MIEIISTHSVYTNNHKIMMNEAKLMRSIVNCIHYCGMQFQSCVLYFLVLIMYNLFFNIDYTFYQIFNITIIIMSSFQLFRFFIKCDDEMVCFGDTLRLAPLFMAPKQIWRLFVLHWHFLTLILFGADTL